MFHFQLTETPLQSCSQTRGLPGLPPLPDSDREASNLYQVSYSVQPQTRNSTDMCQACFS